MGCSSASGRNAGNVAWNENEERKCRDRFMAIFNERYAHYFEFLGGRTSCKGKARLRCRFCGHEFEKNGQFAQIGSNIYCPHCHVHRDDAVTAPTDGRLVQHLTEMYESGMKASEIAAATGVQDRFVRRLLKESGIEFDTNKYRKAAKVERKSRLEASREARRAVLSAFGELSREIREDGTLGSLKVATSRVEHDCRCFAKTAEFIERFAPTWAVCGHCGKEYLFFPSWTRYGRKKPGPYCSRRCSIKANRTNTNIGHRLRKYGSGDKPRDSIKLDEVIERDNGICYICGCRTTKDDHYYSRGWFTIGDSYPTIDHVIPLARGGTHTWDNVRLACHRCNSEKSDSVA